MSDTQRLFWIAPLICIALMIIFGSWIDLEMARYFFNLEGGVFQSNAFLDFIFDYGSVPAMIVSVGAIWFIFKKKWRKPALFLVLTMLVGVAALVHGVFKDHWGRPRPKQVIEFGGKQEFRPFYQAHFYNHVEPSKSFPCGHCSMGFYFLALIPLAVRYRNRTLLWSGIALSVILGGLLGITRMAQGGHFFTDVVFSGLIMWYTALGLEWLIWPNKEKENEGTDKKAE